MKKRVFLFLSILIPFAAQAQSSVKAAKEFIALLDAPLREQACMSWEDAERFNWHFVPRERKGLPLRAMNKEQRVKAYELLKSCMSAEGYKKAAAIVEMELVLRVLEGRGDNDEYRNPGKYYFTIFGEPGAKNPWGWRMEGHHLSLNFSALDGALVSGTPSFMGSNPAVVPDGPKKGLQILKEETELGFQLLNSLEEDQLKVALVAEKAPADIITGNKRTAWLQDPPGLSFAKLKPAQQQLHKKLLAVYIDRYTKLMADILLKEIEQAGWDNLHFAWAGSRAMGMGHYYRIQGPTFIVEYDNTQNGANHVHTTFRDLKNDFGEDVLKQHYDKAHVGK